MSEPRLDRYDQPLRIRLPEEVEIALRIYFRAGGAGRARCPDLERSVLRGISRVGREPLRTAMVEHVRSGRLTLEVVPKALLPPPPGMMLGSLGLAPEVRRQLQESDSCIQIVSSDRLARPRIGLWAAMAASRALLDATAGVFFDPETMRFLPPGCPRLRLPPHGEIVVAEHLQIPHSVDERGLGWVTTAGMGKFGLPDLEIRDAPPNLGQSLAMVMNGVAQRLATAVMDLARRCQGPPSEILVGPEIRLTAADIARAMGEKAEGCGRRAATVRLVYDGRRRDGLMPLVALRPPWGLLWGQGTWLYSVLESVLGAEDELVLHESSDAALTEAHRKAVARLGEIELRFHHGLRPGESLLVKHGFPDVDGFKEYMWVAVTTWRGTRLQGQLANDPRFRTDLRAGDPIELNRAEIYDWVITRSDGSYEGAYTTSVLRGENGKT